MLKDKEFNNVDVELDSKAMVNAIKGNLCVEHLGAYRGFMKVSRVLREGNKCVDFHVNFGQIGNWGISMLDQPYANIRDLIFFKLPKLHLGGLQVNEFFVTL